MGDDVAHSEVYGNVVADWLAGEGAIELASGFGVGDGKALPHPCRIIFKRQRTEEIHVMRHMQRRLNGWRNHHAGERATLVLRHGVEHFIKVIGALQFSVGGER